MDRFVSRARVDRRQAARRCRQSGQAALVLVMGIVLLLATSGSLLAVNSIAHDPLVQADVLDHYAYRAVEAGINSYLSTINAQPYLVNCNTTSTSSTCSTELYDKWSKVPDTTVSTDTMPEYYLWTNPQLCFSKTVTKDTTCYAASATTSPPTGNLEYVQILVVGAAGTQGNFEYEQSVANFAPENGFLTHLWWSDYEAEPRTKTASRTACKYDYDNDYNGATCDPTTVGHGAVFFGPGDVIDGPVFTNDSLYVATKPIFGTSAGTHLMPIDTADPSCQLVAEPGTTGGSPSEGCESGPTSRAKYTKTNSHYHQPVETPPSTDSSLETLAAKDGCVYTGPTTISFIATHTSKTGYMNVYSPETVTEGGHDSDNLSTNDNVCLGSDIRLPDGTPDGAHGNGNGVIYVKTGSGTCSSEDDNPYDAYLTKTVEVTVVVTETVTVTVTVIVTVTTHGHKVKKRERKKEKEKEPVTVKEEERETVVTTTRAQTYKDTDTPSTLNCAGDAFVHDANSAPAGKEVGVAGNLTVAAENNIVITGPLKYTDCQTGFTSEESCTYNDGSGAVNDSLGLIASNYVVVNRPVCPSGHTTTANPYCTTSKKLLKQCATEETEATWTTWEDALCNPGPTLVIDAAVLALSHSFAVDNYTRDDATGKLIVYGAMAQYWRGPVGTFASGTIEDGYSKYYTWDSRLQYVSIPYYLTPGTASWGLAASSIVLSSSCPTWPKRFPAGYKYVKTSVANSTTTFRSTTGKSIARAPTPTGRSTGALCSSAS